MDEKRYQKYEELLMERDASKKKAGSCLVAYLQEFGALLNKAFEKKIECIRLKKSIAIAQMYVNRGQKIDVNAMEATVGKEMAAYKVRLEEMVEIHKAACEAETSSEAKVLKAKKTYRAIAKLIHPDMHPELDGNEEVESLWERTEEAYRTNDVNSLNEIEVLAISLLNSLDIPAEKKEIEDLEERIERVTEEIERIKTTDPYLYKDLLSDLDMVDEKKAEINKEIAEYEAYEKELKSVMDELLSHGVVMIWKTN